MCSANVCPCRIELCLALTRSCEVIEHPASNKSTSCYLVFWKVSNFHHDHHTVFALQEVSVTKQIPFDLTVKNSSFKWWSKQSHSCTCEIQVHLDDVIESTKKSSLKECGLFQKGKAPHQGKGGIKLQHVNYCKYSCLLYHHFTSEDRSVDVFCAQIETDLSGRHCILKPCRHDVSHHIIQVQTRDIDQTRIRNTRGN